MTGHYFPDEPILQLLFVDIELYSENLLPNITMVNVYIFDQDHLQLPVSQLKVKFQLHFQ